MMKKILLLSALFLLFIESYTFCQNKQLENIYIVIGNSINIRSDSDIKSDVMGILKIGQTVKVIKRINKKVKIGNDIGEWVYIDPGIFKKGTTEILKGWVFDKYLARFSDFKIVSDFMNCKLEGYEGDWLLSYEIKRNGTYKRKFLDRDENNNVKVRFCNGKLYRLNNVLVALDDLGAYEILIVIDNGILCSRHYNADGKQICSKCNY
jgi:hypothetical protein